MKLLFLGTSSGWPLPRLGCKCKICSSEVQYDKRLRPSLLVNERLLIDAPPDIYHQLKGHQVDPAIITHILITHAHDDHIMGLYDLTHIYNKREKVRLITTATVLTDIRKKLGVCITAFKIIEIKPFQKVFLGNDIFGWFVPVIHGSIETYGIKLKAPKPFLYAPEFRKILPSSRKALGDLDLAVIDGSSKTRHGRAQGHETIDEGIRLGKHLQTKRVLFTNIGHKTDCHLALEEYVKTEGGRKFGIAFDGLEVKL